jgi:hypothetical protein
MIGDRGGTRWSVHFFERIKGNDKKVKVITLMQKHRIKGKKERTPSITRRQNKKKGRIRK